MWKKEMVKDENTQHQTIFIALNNSFDPNDEKE